MCPRRLGKKGLRANQLWQPSKIKYQLANQFGHDDDFQTVHVIFVG